MFELIQAGPCSYYIENPAKLGVYLRGEKDAYLIDTGIDPDSGRRALKLLRERGWELRGVLNTHAHADHIGGNQYLQRQTGCKVFASAGESVFVRHTPLNAALLYGGFPCGELRHKFFLASESTPSGFDDAAFPAEVTVLPLPGHSVEHVGFRLPDGTVFLGDCVSGERTLDKYQIAFLYDIAAQLRTLDVLETLEAPLFIPAHAAPETDIRPLAARNRAQTNEIAARIVALCAEPRTFEVLLRELFAHYGLTMTVEQYALVGGTVRSYLAWLRESGRLDVVCTAHELLWKAV